MKSAWQNSLSDTKGFPHRPPPLLLPRHPESYLNLQNSVCLSWHTRPHVVWPLSRGPSREPGSQGRHFINDVAGPSSNAHSAIATNGSLVVLANMGMAEEGSCWVNLLVTVGKLIQNRSLLVLRCKLTSHSRALTGIEFCTCHLFMIPNLSRHNTLKWTLKRTSLLFV